MTKLLSIIVPVYNNEGTVEQLLNEISLISGSTECDVEAIFVIDGSPDNSFLELSKRLPDQGFDSKLLALSKNYGSFIAVRNGLEHARGDMLAVMAADCQEPPELVIQAAECLLSDNFDVVIGSRNSRHDPFVYKMMSNIFWNIYRKFVIKEIPKGGVDVFACTKQVRDALLSMTETHTSLIAQLFWVGFRRKEIEYTRRRRQDGLKGSWTFKKRFNYMSDSIFAFTDIPVKALLAVGLIGTFFSITASLVVLTSWLLGLIDVPGYTPLILGQILLFMVTLLGFGIVGSYTWRAFENTKSRPLGLVAIEKTFEKVG